MDLYGLHLSNFCLLLNEVSCDTFACVQRGSVLLSTLGHLSSTGAAGSFKNTLGKKSTIPDMA